jgi:hypothetical protein
MRSALLTFLTLSMLGCQAQVGDGENGVGFADAALSNDLHSDSSFENGTTGFECYLCTVTSVAAPDAPAGLRVAKVVGHQGGFSLGDWPGVAHVTAGVQVAGQVWVRGGTTGVPGKLCLRERNTSGTFVATTCSNAFTFGATFQRVGVTHTARGTGMVDAYVYMNSGAAGVFYADVFQVGFVQPGQPDAGKPAGDAGAPTGDAGTPTHDAGTPPQDAGIPPPPRGSIGEISAANQAVLAFPPNMPSTSTLMAYAHPGGMVVLDPYILSQMTNGGRDLVSSLRAGGAEVLLYVDVMEVPDYQVGDVSRLQMFGCSTTGSCAASMPSSYFFPHDVNGQLVQLSNYPNTFMTDVTKGSAFSNRAVSFLGSWDRLGANGYFLDVLGTRLWTSAWDAISASEQSAWTAGVYDIVTRLRAAMGDQAILLANNTWVSGHPGLNGFCLEHHDISEAPSFASMLGSSLPWHAGRRNLVITTSTAQAQQWRSIAGVTDITPQQDYSQQSLPVASWPFTAPQ